MPSQNTQFLTSFGEYQLNRYPPVNRNKEKQDPLQAWDAADEYLLEYVGTEFFPATTRVLILNDSFGALAVAMHQFLTVSQSDSYVACCAAQSNLVANQLEPDTIEFFSSLESPEGIFNLLLIKIPKSLALLEDQLYRLKAHVSAETTIVAAGMTKNIHRSTLALFEKILGPVKTSLAKKKSRLIYCQYSSDISKSQSESPYPSCYSVDFAGKDYTFDNHANVFSRDGLDAGTRLMLENLPSTLDPINIVDLGSGNGILGVLAAVQSPQAVLRFIDESYMAVASSQLNFSNAFGDTREAIYEIDFKLKKLRGEEVDLILNNPPFHHQNANDDRVAWKMFNDARQVLRKGGELRVVANRHLAYHVKLKKIFGNCRVIASNKKFVVLGSLKE